MAARVDEIMNRELFSVRPADLASNALRDILALGITGAPVLDADQKPVGMVSFRDLVDKGSTATAADCMTSPAVTVRANAPIEEAARLIADTGYHRLAVVDGHGRAVGAVSALDALRGLLGVPARHPAGFPHLDAKTGLSWSDEAILSLEWVDVAPDGPGLLTLWYGGKGLVERPVWVEAADNVRTRLLDIVDSPQTDQPGLTAWIARGHLRFRAASVADRAGRERALASLRAEMDHLPLPSLEALSDTVSG